MSLRVHPYQQFSILFSVCNVVMEREILTRRWLKWIPCHYFWTQLVTVLLNQFLTVSKKTWPIWAKLINVFSLLTSLLHTRNMKRHIVHSVTKWKASRKWILKTATTEPNFRLHFPKTVLCSKCSPLYCFGKNMLAAAGTELTIRIYVVTQPWNFLFMIGCSLMLSKSRTTHFQNHICLNFSV